MRYIGGKSNLLNDINNVITQRMINVNTVIDIFSGSGVVSSFLKRNGYNVIGNDIMYFSYVLSRGSTELNHTPAFANLAIADPIAFLNNLDIANTDINLEDCFIYQNYSPHDNVARMYFQNDNAIKIDIIRITIEAQDEQTKFDLGSKLGFKGEMGFTSMPQDAYLCDYCEATTAGERTNVRSNEEGDSDKYARGIASWCMQMGWVESNQKDVTETYRRKSYTAKLQTYSITRKGEKALIKARGNSSNPRLARVLMFEMLASNKVSSANYLRFVRACIIKALTSSDKSTDQLKKALKGYELDVDDTAIKDHIEGLISIGLEITENAGKYRLLDKIECLEIPARTECVKDNVVDIKDRVRNKLIHLDHKYLALIDLAYSDAASRAKKNADAREFEIQTADLFTKELSFNGQRLGDSRKPDVIISYGLDGTIVDNKSYKDGFNISRTCADEMSRYINENNLRQKSLNPNEWWKNFDSTITAYTFLFITSYLKGQFEDQLEYVSNANGGIKGAAIGVESLLYLSEGIKAGRISHADFYSNFNNKEMIYTA